MVHNNGFLVASFQIRRDFLRLESPKSLEPTDVSLVAHKATYAV